MSDRFLARSANLEASVMLDESLNRRLVPREDGASCLLVRGKVVRRKSQIFNFKLEIL